MWIYFAASPDPRVYHANTEGDEHRMFALVTASQMASASAASFFRRLRRFN
jgi:hypothetical protein